MCFMILIQNIFVYKYFYKKFEICDYPIKRMISNKYFIQCLKHTLYLYHVGFNQCGLKIICKGVKSMKTLIFSLFLVLTVFIAIPAQAQLVVYDDFSGPFVDTARWRYSTSWGADVWPYEGGFRILKKKLSFFNRAYGAVLGTDEIQSMKRQLFLRDVSGVKSLETSIQMVKSGHEITGCSSENTKPSETRVWIGGSFFNDGSGVEPGNGNYTGDILVGIGLYKYSNSDDIPAGYMGVRSGYFSA